MNDSSLAVAGSLRSAAIGYFACAVLVLFICLVTYSLLFKLVRISAFSPSFIPFLSIIFPEFKKHMII